MLDQVTHATFAAVLGSVFRLETASGEVCEATLIEATTLRASRPGAAGPAREPFSLLFRVPRAASLPQRIYALEHPELGRLEMFLAPVGREAAGLILEAVFN